MNGPYFDAAPFYLRQGWAPIPLPYAQKKDPPAGWTGYKNRGIYPSGADVEEWRANGAGGGNIALRLTEDVVGIDVDQYGDKRGGDELAKLEARLGKLPPTYISTSRTDGVSGIRLFRVRRTGRAWRDTAAPGIEIIHYGHRYLVAAPSIHPDTGKPYRWLDLLMTQCAIPLVTALTLLPVEWEEYLDVGDYTSVAAKAHVSSTDALRALHSYPEGDMCPVLTRLVERAGAELTGAASRHDACRNIVAAVVRAGEQGHKGSVEAMVAIHDLFVSALLFGERREPDPGEFDRMVTGAVAIVAAAPTAPGDIGCCGSVVLSPGLVFDPSGEEAFWSSRPELAIIRQFAQARMAAPWAVLLCVLARVVTAVPPQVCLPAAIGGKASINLFVALVGESGMGKGAAEAAAAEAVVIGHEVHRATIGSGEGIGHCYAHREKGQLVRDRSAVLFSVPEVDNLSALGQRQGSTLLPQLRIAWMGEALGFSYADPAKRLPIDEHTYRMCLVLGVQPGRAGSLLDDVDGGTPQRFVFVSVVDRHMPEVLPVEPVPYHWERPEPIWPAHLGMTYVKVCPEIKQAVEANRRLQTAGSVEAIAGHTMLNRIKVATALALLAGRLDVDTSDWALSSTVMRVSDGTRNGVRQFLNEKATQSNLARGRQEGQRSLAADDVVSEAKVARVGRAIVRALSRAGEPMTLRDVKHAISSRDRGAATEALEALVTSGQVEEQVAYKHDNLTRYGLIDKGDK